MLFGTLKIISSPRQFPKNQHNLHANRQAVVGICFMIERLGKRHQKRYQAQQL